MTSTGTHPESYYDAKRALLAKVADLWGRGESSKAVDLEHSIPATLDALGWAEPEAAKDERGKAIKVFAFEVRHVLPRDLVEEWEAPGAQQARKRGVQYHPGWTAYVAAPSKAAALDLVFGDDRKRWERPKVSDVGEVSVTHLGYRAAVNVMPGRVVVKRDPVTYLALPISKFSKD